MRVKTADQIFVPDRAAILKYWCWRAKYCRLTKEYVCARDIRLQQIRKFQGQCAVFKQNCRHGTGFIITLLVLQNIKLFVMGAENLERKKASHYAKYQCYKLHSCKPDHRPPVCGFSAADHYLVLFDNECVMLEVNCKGNGRYLFVEVEKAICDAKLKYEKDHVNENFEFEPIAKHRAVTTPSTAASVKQKRTVVWKMKQRTAQYQQRVNLRLRRILK